MTKAYTRELAISFFGQWIISRNHPGKVFKCIKVTRKGHRLFARAIGQLSDGCFELKTRKFRLATEAEVAEAVANRITV